MKKIISLLVTLCVLASCSLADAENLHFEGKPWINSSFYGIWPSERPAVEDSFELYANYDLYQKALANGDRRLYLPLLDASRQIQERRKSMYTDTSLANPEAEFIRTLYSMYMDTEKRDALAPLLSHAERLRAVKTLEELTALIREEGGLYGLAFFRHSLDTMDSQYGKYYLHIDADPVIEDLPLDPETFESPGKDADGAREMLQRMGWSMEEASAAVDVLISWFENNKGIDLPAGMKSNGLFSLNDIREIFPPLCEMMIAQGLAKEGAEADEIYFYSSSAIIKIKNFWREENLEALKALFAIGMYKEADIILPKEAAEDETADPDEVLGRMLPRAIVEQGYVHSFVPQDRIDLYNELAAEYKEAMRARIERSEWLSEETKKEACRKLDRLVASDILYPDVEFDFSSLPEKLRSCANLLEANELCVLIKNQCEAHFAGLEWQAGNRYGSTNYTLKEEGGYEPSENVFYIGAGALSEILLDTTSRETILGTLGQHIGHELSHAFDTTGSQYNADFTGSLFTDEDQETFSGMAKAIAQQVSSIEVVDGAYSNGERQIGEVLADLTGMSLSLDLAKKTDNFDYDAYFRAFGHFFSYYFPSREEVNETIAYETHPLCYLRINFTVQHFPEFYETYPSVTEGTPMYLAPEDRILVW